MFDVRYCGYEMDGVEGVGRQVGTLQMQEPGMIVVEEFVGSDGDLWTEKEGCASSFNFRIECQIIAHSDLACFRQPIEETAFQFHRGRC